MEQAATFFLVVPASTRSFGDDDWRRTESEYINAWKSAVILLREREVLIDNVTYNVKVDWTPLLRRHERHYAAMAYLFRDDAKNLSSRLILARFPRRPTRIQVVVEANSKAVKRLESIAESLIHDVFLIMNIAAPGCCNFYNAKLEGGERTSEISLSGSEFELCVLPTRRRRQAAGFVPVDIVIRWYESVRPVAGQLPSNPTERALFALLHLAKVRDEMLAVVWLFYAFESLLQTKVGENFSSIVRRLALVLGSKSNEIASMKKEMRALYDLRSSIVHGGFEAIHPMQDEIIDKRIGRVFGRLLASNEFGLVLLVAAIQKMVVASWPQLIFSEVIANEVSPTTRGDPAI